MPAEEDACETTDLGVPRRAMDARHLVTPAVEKQAGLVEETRVEPMVVAAGIEA